LVSKIKSFLASLCGYLIHSLNRHLELCKMVELLESKGSFLYNIKTCWTLKCYHQWKRSWLLLWMYPTCRVNIGFSCRFLWSWPTLISICWNWHQKWIMEHWNNILKQKVMIFKWESWFFYEVEHGELYS
jgi:hypothetical protein